MLQVGGGGHVGAHERGHLVGVGEVAVGDDDDVGGGVGGVELLVAPGRGEEVLAEDDDRPATVVHGVADLVRNLERGAVSWF